MAWTKEWTEAWTEDRALADLRLLVQRIHKIVCLKLMDLYLKGHGKLQAELFQDRDLNQLEPIGTT